MKTTKVSILTTVYNRETYIADCIDSVLASTYEDWELIIVDDGSKDASVKIAKQYEAQDNRIKVYVNKTNLGQFENRNYAASLAKGSYLKYLDSDDAIYPHGLQVMVAAANKFPNAGLIISHDKLHEKSPYPIKMESLEACQAFFFNKGFPTSGPSAALIKKSIFDEVNGFPKPYYVGTDLLLWLSIARISPIVKIQPALNWYREHDGQALTIGATSNEYLKKEYNYYLKYLMDSKTKLSREDKMAAIHILKKKQLRRLARFLFKSGKAKETFNMFRYNRFKINDLKYFFK